MSPSTSVVGGGGTGHISSGIRGGLLRIEPGCVDGLSVKSSAEVPIPGLALVGCCLAGSGLYVPEAGGPRTLMPEEVRITPSFLVFDDFGAGEV